MAGIEPEVILPEGWRDPSGMSHRIVADDRRAVSRRTSPPSVFVTDIAAFKPVWRDLLCRHCPAMTMVEVRALYEDTALVEINATALLARKEAP